MRPIVIAGNWKMNTTPTEAGPLAAAIAAATEAPEVLRVLCPPYVALAAVQDALRGTDVAVGAQNVHAELQGAYTGEIGAPMLRGLASWCIVGHSERRRDQGETDQLVGRKLARCLEGGLRPILCVGEVLADREAGRAEDVVRGQIAGALESAGLLGEEGAKRACGPDGAPIALIAYEPVWAIGTGRTARGADAAAMAMAIRSALVEGGWPAAVASEVPVLYGGSVTAAAIGEFLDEPSIDGALVGGASLKVDEMAGIVARAASAARARRQRTAVAR